MKHKLTKTRMMKYRYLILPIFLIIIGCTLDDEDYAVIDGRVERTLNGEGIADQSVIVMTEKIRGSGWFSSRILIDSTRVITDSNGNFSVGLATDVNAFVTVIYNGDSNYSGSGMESYFMDEPLVIKTDKFIKFKVLVHNTDPFDENDYVKIDFFAGSSSNVVRTGIENFGVDNTYYPEQLLPGGGLIGASEDSSWTGTNVNSIVYYSVSEAAQTFKIRWYMKKNGVNTDGFTDNIPNDINQINSFSFDY